MQLLWLRLNTTTLRNPKVLALIDERGGDRAVNVWIAAIGYSVQWDMGGVMTMAELRQAMPDHVKAVHVNLLVKHGFLDPLPDGTYAIHDYAEYQAAADTARALSETRRKAARVRWDNG